MIATWSLFLICALGVSCAERKFVGRLPRRPRTPHSLDIIHGNKTSITKYPYITSLEISGNQFGAAVILNENWLLTTGFNVYNVGVDELSFRAGSNFYDKQGQVLKASKVVIHPKYIGNSWDYDIAVVQTNKPIKMGKKVQPISLGTKKLKAGTKALTAGWGYYDSSYQKPENLLEAQITVYAWHKCNQTYGDILTKRLMCTFDEEVAACSYDFGDPLVVDGVLYGIFAGGYDCEPGDYPVMYTDISVLHKWVQTTIHGTQHSEN